MNTSRVISKNLAERGGRGFTLIEPVVGIGILVVLIVAFYSGVSQGIFTMRMARENQQATQIMLQKTETVRLCKWSQITNNFIPTNTFTTTCPSGVIYTGRITVANAPVSAPYSNSLKLVTINVTWNTGGVPRSRQMRTLISRWGINNYVD